MSAITENQVQNNIKEDRISVVEISGYLFGFEILKSKEVFPLPRITPVPNSKSYVIGVFNLRGEIYPLLDISGILGLSAKPFQDSDMVILVESRNSTLGILVDRIHGVRIVQSENIKSARGSVPSGMMEYVSGMVSDKSVEIFILNSERLLAALSPSSF